MVWLNPGEVKDDADMAVNWIIRYVLPIGALYLLYSTFKETPESETSRECRKSVSR
jgi:hypothetical protein